MKHLNLPLYLLFIINIIILYSKIIIALLVCRQCYKYYNYIQCLRVLRPVYLLNSEIIEPLQLQLFI